MLNAIKENSHTAIGKRYGTIQKILVLKICGHSVPVVGLHLGTLNPAGKVVTFDPEYLNRPLTWWLWSNIQRPVILSRNVQNYSSYGIVDFDRPFGLPLRNTWMEMTFASVGAVLHINGRNAKTEARETWYAGTEKT